MENLKTWLRNWIHQRPALHQWCLRFVFRLKVTLGLTVFLFVSWHAFLFYLDRPGDHAVQIEIAKPGELLTAPEVVLGDGFVAPAATAPAAAAPAAPPAAATVSPPAPAPTTAPAVSVPVTPTTIPAASVQPRKLRINVSSKSKFPKGIPQKKALEVLTKKLAETNCFPKMPGHSQVKALIKTAPSGAVLAVTLKPVNIKEKRKIASVVKEWTPASVCLKKFLGTVPVLKTKGNKPKLSELTLKLESAVETALDQP